MKIEAVGNQLLVVFKSLNLITQHYLLKKRGY
jgi:hypothetical protein